MGACMIYWSIVIAEVSPKMAGNQQTHLKTHKKSIGFHKFINFPPSKLMN